MYNSWICFTYFNKILYEIKPLVEVLITNIQDYEDTVMTYAEVLRKEGEQRCKQEIAKNLLKSGVDTSVVAKATHLTKKQLEESKKKIS